MNRLVQLDGPIEKNFLLLLFNLVNGLKISYHSSFISFLRGALLDFKLLMHGSVVCDCLYSTRLGPCSGDTHLISLVLTDDIELEDCRCMIAY